MPAMYSFSQNFEDVYIHRAFKDVSDGFYIDAGAYDPVVDSVTKFFYDLGWSGINLEPGPGFASFETRTRDINLAIALGPTDGDTVFRYNSSDPGTSTTAASDHQVSGSDVINYVVPMRRLSSIVNDYARGRHIHFLKLDVEGAEWEIITSTDWRCIRPELILIESTKPYTNVRRDKDWATYFNEYDYIETFFDGINTYYLRKESLDRASAFSFPINVLDGFSKFDPTLHGSGPTEPNKLEATRSHESRQSLREEAPARLVADQCAGDLSNADGRGPDDGRLAAEEQVSALRAEIAAARIGWAQTAEAYETCLTSLNAKMRHVVQGLGFTASSESPRGNSPEALLAEIDWLVDLLADQPAIAVTSLQRDLQAAETENTRLREQLSDGALQAAKLELAGQRLVRSRRSRARVTALSAALNSALKERQAQDWETERQALLSKHGSLVAMSLEKELKRWRERNSLETELLKLRAGCASLERRIVDQAEDAERQRERLENELNLARADAARSQAELQSELVALRSSVRESLDAPIVREAPGISRLFASWRSLVHSAEVHRNSGRYAEAAACYERAARQSSEARFCIDAGDMWREAGLFFLAEQAYLQALRYPSLTAESFARLAANYELCGRTSAACIVKSEALLLLKEAGSSEEPAQ